jgi:C4-dicarboxylate transporter DctQ subunit
LRDKNVKKLISVWGSAERFIVGFFTFTAAMITLYAVFMRYVMKAAPAWSEEVAIYLIIYAVYIVSSTLQEERGHVGATFFIELFPLPVRRWVEVITVVIGLIFCVVIVYYGIYIVRMTIMMGEVSETSLRFPLWIAYSAVPIGITLLTLRLIRRLWFLLFRFSPDLLEGEFDSRGSHQ